MKCYSVASITGTRLVRDACIMMVLTFGLAGTARAESLLLVDGATVTSRPGTFGDAQVRDGRSIDGSASSHPLAGGSEIAVFSNTGSDEPFSPGADRRVSDDIFLPELCGCTLTRYEFLVHGGGDGTGPGFTVDFALYDGCPSDEFEPGQVIPGTEGSIVLPDDGTHTIMFTPAASNLTIPAALWFGVAADRGNAGPFVGAQPTVGFSDNVFDIIFNPCSSTFEPTPLYASFALEIFCEEPGPPDVEMPDPPHGASDVPPTTTLAWNGSEASALDGSDEPIDQPFSVYDCGHEHPDEVLATMQAAIANGEVEDPANKVLPEVAPRSYFGPSQDGVAGFTVPNVTPDDLYWFEDSSSLLTSNFSSGQLYGLMADATNDVLSDYGDNFDFVGFFLTFVPHHQIGGAFYLGLENDVTGIGLSTFNNRPSFGVTGNNVEGWVMMWNEANWGTGAFSSTQLVLGQEFEHRWAMFLDPLPGGLPLQGTSGCGRSSHWNFRVDGQGSGMEIQEWEGSAPAFRISGTLSFNDDIGGVFSYPDLYLMGYVLPGEMDSMASQLRYMDSSCSSPYGGSITNWDSGDIIQVHGSRSPNALASQKHFSTAWVLIHLPGSPPTSNEQNRVVQMLNHWNNSWISGTINRGTMTNVLIPGDGPQFCSVSSDVLLDTTNPPSTVVCAETTDTTCDPGPLQENQTYFWQVISTNDEGETQGPVWSFTTGETGPDCNGNGIPDNVDIANCGGDPDCSDCNSNGIPDECDIDGCGVDPACGDCDGNGVPDGCDPDCQPNGTPDACDIAGGTPDCDGNTIPDECELTGNDCNNNGMPDACDLAGNDCNSNGTPDDCELAGNDCNANNIPDDCELSGNDCNDNDIPDDCELVGNDCNSNGTPDECEPDCQPNGTPDECDIDGGALDCNGNGVPDTCELGSNDCNSNGIPDDCELVGNDCNANNVPDDCELAGNDCNANNTPDDCELDGNDCNSSNVPDDCELVGNDCNGNGTPDECDPDCQPNGTPDDCDIDGGAPDCNSNGIPDACELDGNDCNSNGIPDECELAGNDCNTNSVPDDCELAGNDCNANNTPDDCELVGNDCDGNNTPDECDLASCGADPACADCNTNDTLDGCDIAGGGSTDTNGNGIPDECECVFTDPPTPAPLGGSCVSDGECDNEAVCVEGTCYAPRNRYLSFDARNIAQPGELAALRVTHLGSGQRWWISSPDPENGKGQLVDAPVCLDWSAGPELVHLGDCRIAPARMYEIQAVGCDCDFEDADDFSASLTLPTVTLWGDTVGTLAGPSFSPPNGFVNLDDAFSSILLIESQPTAPHYSWADLGPMSPNALANLEDVLFVILSIEGAAYPYPDPPDCP